MQIDLVKEDINWQHCLDCVLYVTNRRILTGFYLQSSLKTAQQNAWNSSREISSLFVSLFVTERRNDTNKVRLKKILNYPRSAIINANTALQTTVISQFAYGWWATVLKKIYDHPSYGFIIFYSLFSSKKTRLWVIRQKWQNMHSWEISVKC